MRAGFEATGTLKRSEWGLKWNKALEAGGGVVVSDDVHLKLEVEAVQAKAEAAPAKK
jgi:polyisoprenoid-binding protein YceI